MRLLSCPSFFPASFLQFQSYFLFSSGLFPFHVYASSLPHFLISFLSSFSVQFFFPPFLIFIPISFFIPFALFLPIIFFKTKDKAALLPHALLPISAQKNIFLPSSKPSPFISFHTLSSSFLIYCPSLSLYLSLHVSFPVVSFHSCFLSLPSPSFRFFFLFPSFLPGKFEHFSYLPGSAATTLLRFIEPCSNPAL